MKQIELKRVEHNYKTNQTTPEIEPNISGDCIFIADGKPIGFYLESVEGRIKTLLQIANKELISERVPKSIMKRSDGIEQYSAILGGVPPKTRLRRAYPTISSVHNSESATNFIKAMLQLAKESEQILKELIPDIYKNQIELLKKTKPEYRFSDLFTSSISNCNISASFHIDRVNIKETVNIIFTKRKNATGGNLYIPDYDACINQKDNSMLVYPAWRDMHGVTPIKPKTKNGYRNSLIFYPLKAFGNYG